MISLKDLGSSLAWNVFTRWVCCKPQTHPNLFCCSGLRSFEFMVSFTYNQENPDWHITFFFASSTCEKSNLRLLPPFHHKHTLGHDQAIWHWSPHFTPGTAFFVTKNSLIATYVWHFKIPLLLFTDCSSLDFITGSSLNKTHYFSP